MADPFSWTDLGRALLGLTRYVPDKLLRLAWSDAKLLARIETFHLDQAPRFHVRPDNDNPRLLYVGFNVFNFTPFTLVIVGADVRVSLDSRELLRFDARFSAEIPMAPRVRSGFHVPGALNDAQIARVRTYPAEWANDSSQWRDDSENTLRRTTLRKSMPKLWPPSIADVAMNPAPARGNGHAL